MLILVKQVINMSRCYALTKTVGYNEGIVLGVDSEEDPGRIRGIAASKVDTRSQKNTRRPVNGRNENVHAQRHISPTCTV